ncbi:MAG: ABC transporter ATP-binding protein [Candidatus Desantisbacteria bacterium]
MNYEQHIIKIHNLTKRFGDLTAVNNLSLNIEQGEVFGLLGPDGAGKTTLLRTVSGVMKPDKGEIRISGLDMRKDSDRIKEQIGYMPQLANLWDELTVEENLSFFADIYQTPERIKKSRITDLLNFSGLAPYTKRLAGHLSGGMKQKLALICTLVHNPKILILDEPTAGVDPAAKRELWKILHHLKSQGITIILSTSYTDESELCDRIGLMYKGILTVCGSLTHIKGLYQRESLEDIFISMMKEVDDGRIRH